MAVTSNVLNSHLKRNLSGLLDPSQLSTLLQNIDIIKSFDSATQMHIREVFAQGYALNFKIILGFTAAQFLTVAMILRKNQIRTP